MEEELRELRHDLKVARNDVKRYASYALRLEQELAREKQKREDQDNNDGILDEEDAHFFNINGKCTELSRASQWDQKLEKSREEHVVWSRKVSRVVLMLEERRGEAARRDATHTQVEKSVESLVQSFVPFLQHQKRLIGELGRENAKLRDMLRSRPTRRELLTSQLEVERLQRHVQKLRVRAKNAVGHDPRPQLPQERQPVETPVDTESTWKEPSLSERITEERLLQMLRMNTANSTTHHRYLKEKLHCYLSLDLATSESKMKDLTETSMLERVGQICSDIVASCCYILEVEVVGELPNCVRKAQKLSQVSTIYQGFVERIEKLLKRFDKDAFYSVRAECTSDTSCHDALEMVLAHINDVLVELDARREQMKPPSSKAHEVLLGNMKLLQVTRIDQLVPTTRRLVDNMRAEQEFQRGLRELFGLDESANRKQILHVASVLFSELGFLAGNAPLRQSSSAHSFT